MKRYLGIFVVMFSLVSQSHSETAVHYNKELDGFDYPFIVNTFVFNSQNQDLKMRYMDIGNKGAQKVIVLMHGKNFASYYWERVATDLVAKNYRVIMPDQIGFGKSSKPDYYQYSFGQMGLNTKRLLDSLNIKKADVVGHSMGGMLAVTFAVNYQQSVNKLILINPIGLENYGKYTEFKDVNFFYQKQLDTTVAKAIRYQKQNYYDGQWTNEYEKLLEPLRGMLAGKDWKTVAWNNALTYGPIFSESIVDRLSQIQSETFLIIGTRDKTGPGKGWLKQGVSRTLGEYNKLGKSTRDKIRGSTLFELEEVGHMPQYENYPVFVEAFEKALD